MLSQHLSGHRPMSMEAAITYAAAFKVPLASVSKRLAQVQERASTVTTGGGTATDRRQASGEEDLSPRSASLARRLDALSATRRSKAYALLDLTLRTFEADEASAKTKARSRSA